jgi:hypothetical protein
MPRRTWQVIWVTSAEQRLAALSIGASDRQAVADAANDIDRELATDPVNVGESRPGDTRIFHSQPLGVTYEVLPAKNLVRVLRVWSY